MNNEKNNNYNKKEELKNRQMTILHGNRQIYHDDIPCLRLTGKWMREAGFIPGDRVTIVVRKGKLEINKD